MKDKYLVIDVGGTFVKYAVMDADCTFYEKGKIQTITDDLDSFIDSLVGIYRKSGDDVRGIALSSAGMIDSSTGFMYNGGSVECIQNVSMKEILQERCSLPVSVENDARCAGLAEIWRGSLSDCSNAVAMILGTAVGGAVIIDRKIMRGKNCMAGEFSYVMTETDDALNPGKTLAMAGGVPALIRLASMQKNIPVSELSSEIIFDLASQGDEEAAACIREFARVLAVQINNLQFILDADRIAVGGGVSAQPMLIRMIREELEKLNHVYPYPVPMPDITTCRFFNDSNLIGALYQHLDTYETLQ